jgi:hypothetical protein
MTEAHRARVLEHQQIAALFNCSLEELFETYQREEPEADGDTTWTCMVYSIGQWRFGRDAWGNHQIEFFKERARNNAAAGIPTPGRTTKRAVATRLKSLVGRRR